MEASATSILCACRPLFALVCLFTFLPVPAQGGDKAKTEITHVLELFTSQGCSSCPPADETLSALADRPHVLGLSYHVDYWDYIGWRDVFGSSHNTERQRAYARSFSNKTVYTPQLVINGAQDVVGSHRGKIEKLMAQSRIEPDSGVSVRIHRDGENLHVITSGIPRRPGKKRPMLVFVTFADRMETQVDRGENEGRTLVNTHPVRSWQVMGMVGADGMEVELPMSSILTDDGTIHGCAAMIQAVNEDGSPGRILAATQMDIDPALTARR
ncbi:DUF1223 domain-containing protein [Jiella marina]|uniref:DUF1223 domain-containing protein n=1 Tax=Jiella sp. LLJ827 TaxID=2917712 RepID=UPI0021018B07|nr:DUF1223 domain-containing protein [Jiella sp. LLJ827]MCQ0987094.1 DUF1223 domain-containing protein [Jiella sp. LLJ827]